MELLQDKAFKQCDQSRRSGVHPHLVSVAKISKGKCWKHLAQKRLANFQR